MSTTGSPPTVADVVAALDRRYPPAWAEEWDRVGLVLGEPDRPVRRVACVIDVVPETVEEALAAGADLIVAHHPLLLRGVSSVAATTYKGRIVHRLIKADVALYVAHTNADVAAPGVSDALAARFGLTGLRPLHPPRPASPADGSGQGAADGSGRGIGRIGELPVPMTLAELTRLAAAVLPVTAWGVRAAGDPGRMVRTLAVSGGSGDGFLAEAAAAGVDAFLTSDLRHHPAGEHLAAGGPALLDAAHWATERPWLDDLAAHLADELGVETVVSDLDTDPWTVHAAAPRPDDKEPRP
ncbi:Nif3-like dinuclear metal center hexameric protein [Micromonospora sp. WMMD1128]|uniref:Nif3-like dinuclear metal center hexameric protein n=1 Tax=Micromonospora sp. WMMD1128 TaxID=3015150 RepID=UPI00248BF4ED|nr:Nif3-like dinuclear metal center hexameric protein [Micromonospora sp. WMMD1128]WBB75159.1 Nif3-like dinuclear metal center hexameric protein [Micromonospora sp. WMMD1128]